LVLFLAKNNIHNKENNRKPEKGHSNKTIYVKTCTEGGGEKFIKASGLKRAQGRCTCTYFIMQLWSPA